MVVDVGGTTSDVGALTHGFPREASVAVDIGGVRTNFRMPDVLSFGLGGGSPGAARIRCGSAPRASATAHRRSARLRRRDADHDRRRGGGRARRHRRRGAGDGPRRTLWSRRRWRAIQEMADAAVDRMKTSAEPIPVIVVGGGSILSRGRSAGASEMVKPRAFRGRPTRSAPPSAQISRRSRPRLLARRAAPATTPSTTPRRRRREKAIAAGADPATVQIVDVEDVPLTYLPGNATRIRVKAVGDLTL